MEAEEPGSSKRQWNEERRRKEPTLYDEWLNQEKTEHLPPRQSIPLRHRDTAETATDDTPGTVRAVTPESAEDGGGDAEPEADISSESGILSQRGTSSFERTFIPYTTTTVVGGPAALGDTSSSKKSKKPRKLVKEREWHREARLASHSPPSSRNGSTVSDVLARNSSKTNTSRSQGVAGAKDSRNLDSRPRTRTLEERYERSTGETAKTSRNRMGSVNIPPPRSSGAEYLASVPASTSPPSAPSMHSVGQPVQAPEIVDLAGRRSISPSSSSANDSATSNQPHRKTARRIAHLMKTLNGRMSGNVLLRRHAEYAWTQIYCYIQEQTGALMYEPRSGDAGPRTLVSGLQGCGVRPNLENETPYLVVELPHLDVTMHLKLLTQSDFDSWYAALLYWQSQTRRTSETNGQRRSSSPPSGPAVRPELPPRTSSAKQRDRTGSAKSDRRKSVVNSLREAPVIKIGKMIYWDTNIGYSNSPGGSSGVGQPTTGRPHIVRMQSYGSKRWRRISGQLRENGELKLHSDSDNSLISVVQLSQLSRCAIQRLDPSVLDNEFCIAIYPQYTSSLTDNQPGFIRPIFLSLENRVLYEVWFVLLRAFTIPQLYGPRMQNQDGSEKEEADPNQEMENMIAATADMFRMERALSVKVVEAKMFPPPANEKHIDTGFSGGHGRGVKGESTKPEQHGYYAEVLLDNETRGKTLVKFEGPNPLWAESFEFLDLPPVLTSASVVIKRRPPDHTHIREQHESKLVHEAYGFTSDQHGGFTGLTFDVTCGKVEIYLQELEDEKEHEKWWPVVNMHNQRVGEVLIKARAEEGVILMGRDYKPMGELLHRFSNGLTMQIAQTVPEQLKRVSDCFLNIFQVSGKVNDWLMHLIEEEIDGIHKETPIHKLRYSTRLGSDSSHDPSSNGGNTDRELIVRDMNKNATLEANLLFRGNTLLTKSLDAHMKRVGKEYLYESLEARMKELNEKDPDCEVDPNRITSQQDLDRNWRRLLLVTQKIWEGIVAATQSCPVELRVIFRHIRACAEDRYGDFLRSVTFSSVSGFLFLRFFCPALLNPKLFGLLKDDAKLRTRRTLTLIAKSLQTLGNMASFGAKEPWMEPMNAFLTQNRTSFKTFISEVCTVPPQPKSSSTYPPGVMSADTHLSYTTPMTIMQRLPPTSREGFPSLPYLVDQARSYATLVHIWLEATTATSVLSETTASAKSHSEVMAAIRATEGDLMSFHEVCVALHKRTQECLSRAERAERPNSRLSFQWEEMIEQLQTDSNNPDSVTEIPTQTSLETLADQIAGDPVIVPSSGAVKLPRRREWDVVPPENRDEGDEIQKTKLYDATRAGSQSAFDYTPSKERPGSSGLVNSVRESLRKAKPQSRGSDSAAQSASASVSNVSSAMSSDTEHTTGTTALPSYDREVRHRERREAAKQQIKQQVEAAQIREKEREKQRHKMPIVSALRKRREKEIKEMKAANNGASMEGYTSYGL